MSKKLIVFSLISFFLALIIYKHQDLSTLANNIGGLIITTASGGRITLSNDDIVMANTNQTITNISSSLPGGFPKTLPIFPGSTIDLSVTSVNDDGISTNFISHYPLKDIVGFYQKWLPIKGWKIESSLKNKDKTNIFIENKNWQGNIWISTIGSHSTSIGIDLFH